jgi:hypothetical protein
MIDKLQLLFFYIYRKKKMLLLNKNTIDQLISILDKNQKELLYPSINAKKFKKNNRDKYSILDPSK